MARISLLAGEYLLYVQPWHVRDED